MSVAVKNPPRKVVLNLGGELCTGDVVGISYNNHITFGWFVESGAYGSLKYIGFNAPKYTMDQYNDFASGKTINNWWAKRFAKGFHFKHIGKDYIVAYGPTDNRAFKVPNPEQFFKGSVQEQLYEESKKVLNDIKFPAR